MLLVSLKPVVRWHDLGVHLGLSHATLEKIDVEQVKRVEDCKREMLVSWLQSATNCTKQDLENALSKLY